MIPPILIAAASAACPDDAPLAQDVGRLSGVVSQYCKRYVDGSIIDLTDANGWKGDIDDLTDENLCAPATEAYPCCSYTFYRWPAGGRKNVHRCYDAAGRTVPGTYDWNNVGLVCSATRQEHLWYPLSNNNTGNQYEVIKNCMVQAPTTTTTTSGTGYQIPNGCQIPIYTTRKIVQYRINEAVEMFGPTGTYCAESNDGWFSDPSGNLVCTVSDDTHTCCSHDIHFNQTICHQPDDQGTCNALVAATDGVLRHVKLCSGATKKEPAGLSAGATAGIVVAGILGPFALGLIYKIAGI